MTSTTITYTIVDVFTRTRFSGNPVAVIHDAHALDTVQMQDIAREFGFSETTFILPPRTPAHHAQVRIFTPLEEIPFAGHPNIGTVFVMGAQQTAARGALPDDAVLEELGGDVSLRPIRENGVVIGAEINAPQPLQIIGPVSPEVMSACLGLPGREVQTGRIAPCVATVGLPFAFVELSDLNALSRIAPDVLSFSDAAEHGPRTVDGFAVCAFVVLNQEGENTHIRSRVLSPLGHPAEDPATGSASAALGALLAQAAGQDRGRFEITQGVEIGRPSDISVTVAAQDARISIRGLCVKVATGTTQL